MMRTSIRIISAIMAALTLTILFAGCGDTGTGAETSAGPAATTVPESTSLEGYDADGYILDTLGELDYKKEKIQILYWSDVENQEYFSEKLNGNEVNDAIYHRNEKVAERLNVELVFVPTPGNSGASTTYSTFLQAAVSSGEAYDIVSAHSRTIGLCAYNGLTQDLLKLENLNLDMPWWQDSLLEMATINGQLHFVSGDISTNMLYMMYVVFYNKQLLADLMLEDPFTAVTDGSWTYDKMIEMSTGVYSDLDGIEGKSDGDRFGQAAYKLHIDSYLWGSGITAVVRDEAGNLKLSDEFTGEKCIALLDKLYNYLNIGNDCILYSSGDTYKTSFREGRSLFITDRADIAITDLDGKEFELGILPVPKYSADQKDYCTLLGNPFSLYAVSVNATDPDRSAAVLECMASESYRKTTPAIFVITMKYKYSSDNNASMVYDIIRDGAVYDIGRIFWKTFASGTAPDTLFETYLLKGGAGWSVAMKTNKIVIGRTLTGIQEKFAN